MFKRVIQVFFCAALMVVLPYVSQAKDLTIATRATPAVDPHYQWLSTNVAYSMHIFDSLVKRDEKGKWLPGLAVSWRQIDDTTWEFKLRHGVKFHDGSDFTAEDVVFSIHRVSSLPNNPNPYTANIRSISDVKALDPYTIQIKTRVPDPLLPGPLANIFIVSHAAAKGMTPADFRSGKAAIGTGPYKFVSYTPEDRLVVTRNDEYWGGKPQWDKVTFRIISNDAARVAALLSGDVDVIDFVPGADVPRIERDPKLAVYKGPSSRLIYLLADVGRSPTPDVTDANGAPMSKNPMQDIRVRKAMAMAINRKTLVSRVMGGLADPAYQMVPKDTVGFDPTIPELKYDPQAAKKLLAEAGYPDGFGLTIHCSNNRYPNDAKVCQAAAQMLSRIGLKMKVVTMPLNVFFPKIKTPKSQFSFILIGWGNNTGNAGEFLTSILHTYDRNKRMGHGNRAYYSNPVYDRMVENAVVERDPVARQKKMQEAVRYITETYVPIPLYVQYTVLAAKKILVVTPRADEETLAMEVRPAR
jgi:peptide/nickel transport system substrate-binding protein